MKKTFVVSLIALVTAVAITVWSIDRYSHTQHAGNREVATQAVNGEWVVVSAGLGDNLRDFQFLDENHGWAITTHSVWKTDDGGRIWTEIRKAPNVKLLEHYEPQETMEKVQFLNQNEGWVLEGTSIIRTKDSGASWQKYKPDRVLIRSIHFLDRDSGWFVGQLLRLPSRKGEVETWHPVIYGTKDGGENWRRLYIGPEERYPLWDVWPLSSEDIWAVGFSILHSTDRGATWNKVHIKDWQGVSGMPGEIRFLDSNVGWMKTNEPGGYLFTNDGGKTWQPRPVPSGSGSFADIVHVSSTEAWGVARDIFHSNDSGYTWTKELDGDFFKVQYLKEVDMIFAAGKVIAKRKRP